jgi:galactokinase
MTSIEVRKSVIDAGRRAFGESWRPTTWASAPGRLELLGNHIDYSGGSVLAAAIDRSVRIGIGDARTDGIIDVAVSFESQVPFSLDPAAIGDWRTAGGEASPADYLTGVIAALNARSIPVISGAQLAIAGDVPIGFGMSSSAALCVAAVLTLAAERPSDRDVVLIAQEAEHRAGSPVGAMDQSASVAGEVILFNGGDVSWQPLHPVLGNYVFAVANSGVSHALSTSSYSSRVSEAQTALSLIRERLDENVQSLAAVSLDQLDEIESADWLDETLKRRVRHVVSESQRVAEGMLAVAQADWHRFGTLMNESGQSSATDYEISHPVVEELVAIMKHQPGVLGARMMGGGEGGPALALIDADAVPDVRTALLTDFYTHHSIADPQNAFQPCTFGPGASID